MDVASTVTAKGQVTIPKAVRDALGIGEGDRLLFRVVGDHALLARTPDLLELAGTIPTPADVADLDWSEVRALARQAQASRNV